MKGAIFDVDGTMLCSMDSWARVTMGFFAENKLRPDEKDMIAFKSMTLAESLPLIKEKYGLPMTVEEISDRLRTLIITEYAENIPAKDGLCEFIKRLHENGIQIAIATSGYDGCCQKAFERLGIIDYISAAAYSAEVTVNKSEPDIYLLAAKRLGLNASDCVVFEDLLMGICGAKKGGFVTCAIEDVSNKDEREDLKKEANFYTEKYSDELYEKIFEGEI